MIGRDAALPRSVLADPTWRYVALGHIHKHQNLNANNNPPVVYSGSIERIDFGEEHEQKGFVVADITDAGTTWQFQSGYKRQPRRFVTIECDVCERPDPTAAVIEAIEARGDLSEAVVRVIIKLRQEQEATLVEREIVRALEGCYYAAGLNKNVVRPERQRLGGVSVESLTPVELLARYFELKQVDPGRARLLQQHAEALIMAADSTAR